MGKSPQTAAAQEAEQEQMRLAGLAYPLGFEAMKGEQAGISAMQGMGGETPAMREAFGGSRAGLLDAASLGGRDALKRGLTEERGATQAGNVGATLASPSEMGTSIARALYGSRIAEASGAIEERDKMLGFSAGQSQTAGSGALGAFGNTLQNIPLMQNFNSTSANLLGALNLGTSLYGAGTQAGLFSGGNFSGAGWATPSAGIPDMGGVY